MDELSVYKPIPLYTVVEVSALIVGVNPEEVREHDDPSDPRDFYVMRGDAKGSFQPTYLAVTRSLISNDLVCAKIETLLSAIKHSAPTIGFSGGQRFPTQSSEMAFSKVPAKLSLNLPLITSNEVKEWLRTKGINSDFFSVDSSSTSTPEYMNKDHTCFAPKLFAAVKAWEGAALDDENYGTPKQQMEKWLTVRAVEFGLVHQRDGANYNKGDLKTSAIEEICAIANWNQEGGRSTKAVENANLPPKVKVAPKMPFSSVDEDLDIPY